MSDSVGRQHAAQQPFFNRSLGGFVGNLNGTVSDRHHGNYARNQGRFDANQ